MFCFMPRISSSALIILILNTSIAFSQIAHEAFAIVACFHNGIAEAQVEFDAQEVAYVDFERHELVYTVPTFLVLDVSKILGSKLDYDNVKRGQAACIAFIEFCKEKENNPPEERDPPESIIYPAEESQLAVENRLICFINNFYPPYIEISWTKNGRPVSEGVSLSRYYPNNDGTFHHFSTLTFTPSEGDIYSCTVEHAALERPTTRIWVSEFSQSSHGPDIFCGVGLTLGLLGVAAGTFLIAKGHYGNN